MTISVILINWNSELSICGCLDRLLKEDKINLHVVISDNNSSSVSLNYISQHLVTCGFTSSAREKGLYKKEKKIKTISCKIIKNTKNLGFTGANRVAIQYILRKNDSDLILFLNSDTYPDNNALAKMATVFKKNINVGLVSCKILLSNSKNIIWSLGGYDLNFFGNFLNSKSNCINDNQIYRGVHRKKIISGCVMLFRPQLVETIGVQDDRFFFGLDDVEYSLRATKFGFQNFVNLDAIVYHDGSLSTQKRIALRTYYLFRNTFLVRWLYFSFISNIYFTVFYLLRYGLLAIAYRIVFRRPTFVYAMWLGLRDFFCGSFGIAPKKLY